MELLYHRHEAPSWSIFKIQHDNHDVVIIPHPGPFGYREKARRLDKPPWGVLRSKQRKWKRRRGYGQTENTHDGGGHLEDPPPFCTAPFAGEPVPAALQHGGLLRGGPVLRRQRPCRRQLLGEPVPSAHRLFPGGLRGGQRHHLPPLRRPGQGGGGHRHPHHGGLFPGGGYPPVHPGYLLHPRHPDLDGHAGERDAQLRPLLPGLLRRASGPGALQYRQRHFPGLG